MAKIHFIGAGQMAEAIIRAAIGNGAFTGDEIAIADIDPQRVTRLIGQYHVQETAAPTDAELIVIAVRPQDDIDAVTENIRRQASPQAIVISIVAGVTLQRLAALLGPERPIARVIPNTLTDTGYGYSGVTLNGHVAASQVEPFLQSFGKILYLPESLIDVFTGFGVAGPNYIYYFVESLTDAGVLAGLPRAQATEVVLENLVGAAAMLKQSGLHPRQLLDINNSPAGVGMHGLYELNNSDFAAGLQRSVLASVKRTIQLGTAK
jgi:pyrroline-5-carboxylate reductase